MNCYNCGCRLSEHDFCTGCGADVSKYKAIMRISNLYYNEGLEKAQIRDLSGAVTSLRQSLKFNKNTIEARNLLGLVYFEMGEVVAALSEWVISKNLRPQKNIADDYIDMVQSNATRLDTINQTIKKYNQALAYCMQDSKDLARIQLKKVLSLNPKFVRAHQLLALLYIDSEQWDKAKRELDKCCKIDVNNTQTLRYLKEVEKMLMPDENGKTTAKNRNEDAYRYQSDNEIIIQPLNVHEPKGNAISTIFNVIIGLVLGIAVMYFLIVPSAVAEERNKSQIKEREMGESIDEKNGIIANLQTENKNLEADNLKLREDLEAYVGSDGTLKTVDELFAAAAEYITNKDALATAAHLENVESSVNLEETSEAFQLLYETLVEKVGTEAGASYYTSGSDAYESGDYDKAIEDLNKAVRYDPENGDIYYTLGHAYRRAEQKTEAIAAYTKVLELQPDTERARKAQNYIDELSAN